MMTLKNKKNEKNDRKKYLSLPDTSYGPTNWENVIRDTRLMSCFAFTDT